MLHKTRTVKTKLNTLPIVTSSLMQLYQLAKGYHLHVTGPSFYGDHKTYDGIAEVALDWYDSVAEYARGRGESIPYEPSDVTDMSLIRFNQPTEAREMLQSMQENLQEVISYLQSTYENGCPTTDSLLQDLEVELNKRLYFISSSL